VRIAESVKVPAWSYLKAFEDVRSSLAEPVFIHEALRASACIVDRRLATEKGRYVIPTSVFPLAQISLI
jgi:hypothetical protein